MNTNLTYNQITKVRMVLAEQLEHRTKVFEKYFLQSLPETMKEKFRIFKQSNPRMTLEKLLFAWCGFEYKTYLRRKSKSFYVYALLDPRKRCRKTFLGFSFTRLPFYIGKGTGDRANVHLRMSDKDYARNPRKTSIIKSLLDAGLDVPIVILYNTKSEEKAFKLEAALIREIGYGEGKILSNLTGGGAGTAGLIVSKTARLRHSLAYRTRPIEEKERISKNLSKRVADWHANLSIEDRAKRSAAIKASWDKYTPEERAARAKRHSDKLRSRTPDQIAETTAKFRETLRKKKNARY